MNAKRSGPAYRLAFCSLMAALAVAVMLSSSVIPILTYASPMMAGLVLIPVLYEFGSASAWMTWAVAALLSLLLCADREAAFFFLFLGCYPILKPGMEKLDPRGLRLTAKLGYFAAAVTVQFLLLAFLLGLEDMRSELLLNILVYVMLAAIMMIYDRVLDRMLPFYVLRLRPKLMKSAGQ